MVWSEAVSRASGSATIAKRQRPERKSMSHDEVGTALAGRRCNRKYVLMTRRLPSVVKSWLQVSDLWRVMAFLPTSPVVLIGCGG
jgi:hypothetical protein